MNRSRQLFEKLPGEILRELERLPSSVTENLEEIRFRTGEFCTIFSSGKEYRVGKEKITSKILNQVFNLILNYSVYAYEEELKNGYISIEGGHRAGICGRVVMEDGKVKSIKDISSLNLRRSRELPGIADPYVPFLWTGKGAVRNTLILSPPKCGKTTLLRDFIRCFSTAGLKVGVCDERSELAGMHQGERSYDLGPRTDVLDGCPKAQGMIMLIRSMAPDLLVTDEIGREEDGRAIEAAVCAGISLLTTIHGSRYEDLLRSRIGELVRQGIFQRILFLENQPSVGTVRSIRNEKNEILWSHPC
ncbi:MAG: stage III sporulation protein AA [Firmicutes bacterium]|nr:stage III sporulation protein AA [Bacillota bacterium]